MNKYKLVPLQVGDTVMLRKNWEKYCTQDSITAMKNWGGGLSEDSMGLSWHVTKVNNLNNTFKTYSYPGNADWIPREAFKKITIPKKPRKVEVIGIKVIDGHLKRIPSVIKEAKDTTKKYSLEIGIAVRIRPMVDHDKIMEDFVLKTNQRISVVDSMRALIGTEHIIEDIWKFKGGNLYRVAAYYWPAESLEII